MDDVHVATLTRVGMKNILALGNSIQFSDLRHEIY